jgi:hypothetical protein
MNNAPFRRGKGFRMSDIMQIRGCKDLKPLATQAAKQDGLETLSAYVRQLIIKDLKKKKLR